MSGNPFQPGAQIQPARFQQPQFCCPFCKSNAPPIHKSEVAPIGLALFVVMLLFLCLPLCWIGLLIRNEFTICSACGIKIG